MAFLGRGLSALVRARQNPQASLFPDWTRCLSDGLKPDGPTGEAGKKAEELGLQSSGKEKHWMDRRLPGLREWLERKNEDLWIRGVRERCRQIPSLVDRQDFIAEQLSKQHAELLEKHQSIVTDERSQTHLQMGCLVVATERVLKPWIRNSQEVADIIKGQMGSFTSPVLRFLLKQVMYLSRDPFASSVRRLRGLRTDYGRSFKSKLLESDGHAELRIRDCLYHRLLAAEQTEHLLSCCCCKQDSIWFENLQSHKIGFCQQQWLGSGDPACSLSITKLPK